MSDYVDRLEAELIRGAYGPRRRDPRPALAAIAVAVIAGLVVLVAQRDAPVERSVQPAPPAETLDLPTPGEFRAATAEEAERLPGEPVAEQVAAVPAPPAGQAPPSKSDIWFVYRSDGQVCLSVDEEARCVTPPQYEAGRLYGVGARRFLYGLVPPDVVRAGFLFGEDDRLEFGVDVVDQLWHLPIPIDSAIALQRADGPAFTIEYVEPDLLANYSALRDPGNVVEPPELVAMFTQRATRPGAETHLLRDDPAFRFYAVVSDDRICRYVVFDENTGGGGCGPDAPERFATIGPSGFMRSTQAGQPDLISALFPDGISEVTFVYASGAEEVVPVEANLAAAFVDGEVDHVTWVGTDGVRYRTR